MQRSKGTLIGQRGVRLAYGSWLPDEEPHAIVVLVHGMSEHMGRYAHVVEALAERGFAVYGMDHRGHGESGGTRAHVERFTYFVEDQHLLIKLAKAAHPGLPAFMIGHSMGGLIATLYTLAHEAELAGLVLSGAALHIGERISPMLKRMSRVLATLVPTLPVTRSHREPESILSRDPDVQARFDSDPLCYKGKIRARFGHELLTASYYARTHMANLSLPLLIMHGAADRLTDPRGSERLYKEARSRDKTLKLWSENRHEIFNELDRAEVIAYTCDWLEERLKRIKPELAEGVAA